MKRSQCIKELNQIGYEETYLDIVKDMFLKLSSGTKAR
jgi:hypothetical protein